MSFDAFLTACALDEFKRNSNVYSYDDDCYEAYLKKDADFPQAYFRKYYWLHSMIAKCVAGCGQKYQAHSHEHIQYHYLLNRSAFVWELTRSQLEDIVSQLKYHLQHYKDEMQYRYHQPSDSFYPIDQHKQDVLVDQDEDYPGDVCGFTMWWVVDEVKRALDELTTFLADNPDCMMFVYSGSY